VDTIDQNAGRLRRLDELRAAITAAEASATSPGAEVTVVVAAGGAVTAVTVTARGLRAGTHALGELIVQAAKDAAAELHAALTARAAELSGGAGSFGAVLGGSLPAAPPLELSPTEEDPAGEPVPSPPGFPPMEGLEAALRELRERAVAQHARYAEAAAVLAGLTATGTAPAGSVTVTLSPAGLVAVDIDPVALRRTPQEVGDDVLRAIRAGTAELARAMAERVQGVAGPGLDIAAIVREHLPEDVAS
jgi:DNA-binding protein YbaB